MSVDKRIVEMQFENQQFEKGISQSSKSLEAFKKGLNMDDAAKGFSNLEKVSKSFSLANMAEGIQNISSKFSAMNIIGITALQNVTNSALNAGKRILSAFTVDPIKTGLEEYETKIGSIQTILTNTSSKGTTIDQVTATLNELNTYADQTIYNFAEMTRNIGTFTAAGVGLEESAIAIKGIANLAAGSGSNAQQASTAMYQLSQALAAGSVKLQDWNSVVNAGMGGELFQNALKDTAKEMGIVVDAGKPFRETLQDGWLTADVLTKTLSKFAEDKMLLQAATQVKTFTQMVDTMKESVQSGWSMSWEYIIGDKDQAAKLFTAINDGFGSIVGASADARNEMLKFWNENGGRDAIITALSNAFKGLSDILKPITSAFRDIFPKMTGQQLVDISNKVKDLSEKFKIGEATANNIHRTFKGFFALLDIGVQAISAIASGIATFVTGLAPAGDGLLGITASIGDFIVGLNESIKSSDIFTKAVNGLGTIMTTISNTISNAIDNVVNVFRNLTDSNIGQTMKTQFKPFTTIANIVETSFNKMASVMKPLMPIFLGFSTVIGNAFKSIQEAITNSLRNGDFKAIVDLLNGGIFAGILLGLKNFVDSLSGITDGAGGLLDGITGILDGVKDSLSAYQSQLKAKTLITIAGAIAILSAALIGLSLVDPEKLNGALVAVSVMFGELFASMAIFEKIMGSSGFTAMGKVTTAMIALSTAILILSQAVKNMADLNWEGLIKGLTGVASLSAILVVSAKSLSSTSGRMMKGSLGLIAFATAINILTQAVEKLGALDIGSLTKGLVGVGVLMTEISLFMNATNIGKMGVTKSVGILVLASAMVVMAEAVSKLGSIDIVGITKGLAAMGVIFTEVSLFMNLTGGATKVVSTAVGMTILGGAMIIFAQAIGTLGSMSIAQIGKGLAAMGGALVIIAGAMAIMPKNIIAQGAGLLVIATSLNVLSSALSSMGDNTWTEIAKSIVTLAGSLGIIAIAMQAMTTALPGAAALLVISGALAVLTPVLTTLGNMSIGEIVTSLMALVGVFTVLGGAGLILAPLTPALMGLAAAVALLGVGSLAAGAGILAFSAGLSALAISGTAGAAALVAIVTSILGLIPFIAVELAKGIVEFVRVIGDSVGPIGKAIEQVVIAILDVIINVTPKLMQAITVLLDALLKVFIDYIPKIVDAGMKLIVGFLKGISDNIADVVKTAIDVVINFIKGVTDKIPDVIQSGVDLILGFINGLADSIRNNTPLVTAAIENLFSALIEASITILFGSINGFINVGKQLIEGLAKGISNTISNVCTAVGSLTKQAITTLSNTVKDFTSVGKNVVDGFINGIKSKISDLASTAANMAKKALDSAKNALGIHSPSREFEAVGKFADEGLINGLLKYASKVGNAGANIGDTAKEALRNSLSNMTSLINGDIDLTPTIRPVIDMSNVESGKRSLRSMFDKDFSFGISSAKVDAIASRMRKPVEVVDTPQNGSDFTINNEFNISEMVVREEADIDRIAGKLFKMQQQASRNRGVIVF